jgi:TRAP-type C4-dicarboxylate transport system permease large subunit
MITPPSATKSVLARSDPEEISRLYLDGIVAGVIGAATIAIWFLILDTVNGRPLYTPTVLGTALFRRGEGLASPESLPISFEMVLLYTWVHGLVFAVIGGVASRLLQLAERNPNLGFGILLLFVVFEFGFLSVATLVEGRILQALAWQAILVGNLLAVAAMAGYFWRRHPNLKIRP